MNNLDVVIIDYIGTMQPVSANGRAYPKALIDAEVKKFKDAFKAKQFEDILV